MTGACSCPPGFFGADCGQSKLVPFGILTTNADPQPWTDFIYKYIPPVLPKWSCTGLNMQAAGLILLLFYGTQE